MTFNVVSRNHLLTPLAAVPMCYCVPVSVTTLALVLRLVFFRSVVCIT